jgi:hypothetical protein
MWRGKSIEGGNDVIGREILACDSDCVEGVVPSRQGRWEVE